MGVLSNEIKLVLVVGGILALFLAFIMLELLYVNVNLDRQVRDRQGVIYKIENEYTEIRAHLRGIEVHLGVKDKP
jgi:hypothetical protein